MNWVRERDALIAQTLAFVQSVTGRKDDAAAPRPDADRSEAAQAKPVTPIQVAASEPARVADPVQAPGVPRSTVQSELQNEIRARVESFRAHQERFNREREEYFSATITKLRAAMKDLPPPRTGD